MRIYMLAHSIVEKFVPLSEQDKLELQSGALEWYNKQLEKKAIREAKNAEITAENEAFKDDPEYSYKSLLKPSPTEKLFELLESWYMRYVFAIAFVFLVPIVKQFINGEYFKKDAEPEDDEDEISFADYMDYKRMSKR